MSDWNLASKELDKMLSPSVVKSRKQGGASVSYIEGWLAISEANRIFGFDGWTRETVAVNCVSDKPRKIGPEKKDGFGVSYTAKVRVIALGIVREGFGAGHGIDQDCGQAHESAIKEAETDAMKRALMTFGNPFGLALYDKTKANVGDDPEPDQDFTKVTDDLIEIVNLCTTITELDNLTTGERFKTESASIPSEELFRKLKAAYSAKKAALVPKAA